MLSTYTFTPTLLLLYYRVWIESAIIRHDVQKDQKKNDCMAGRVNRISSSTTCFFMGVNSVGIYLYKHYLCVLVKITWKNNREYILSHTFFKGSTISYFFLEKNNFKPGSWEDGEICFSDSLQFKIKLFKWQWNVYIVHRMKCFTTHNYCIGQ